MSIEEQMQWDCLRDHLQQLIEAVGKLDQRLTDIESRLGELANHVMADKQPGEPGPSFVASGTIYINGMPIQAGDKITVDVPPWKQTFIATAEPANPDTRDGEYSSHLMAGPFKSSPVLPVSCDCAPWETCAGCTPPERT